jgi:cyclophilin family peptidyl-prolyl cis-trans isomerase
MKQVKKVRDMSFIILGTVSMANSGKNSNSSQFYFCLRELPQLNGKHVVFGNIIDGK